MIFFATLMGCSSGPRVISRPSATIAIVSRPGTRPTASEVADIHRLIQPEIEKSGYVMAKNPRSARFVVYVNYPVDPRNLSRLTFVEAEPAVPFLRADETRQEQTRRANQAAIAELVREPK